MGPLPEKYISGQHAFACSDLRQAKQTKQGERSGESQSSGKVSTGRRMYHSHGLGLEGEGTRGNDIEEEAALEEREKES